MGSLCHEVAKLQADRAQLEELLAQVSHPHSPVYWPRLRLSCCSGMDACPAPIALQQTLAAISSAITPASDMHISWLTLQEAHRLQDVYAERDELQAHLDALDAEVTACTRVPGHDQSSAAPAMWPLSPGRTIPAESAQALGLLDRQVQNPRQGHVCRSRSSGKPRPRASARRRRCPGSCRPPETFCTSATPCCTDTSATSRYLRACSDALQALCFSTGRCLASKASSQALLQPQGHECGCAGSTC